MTQFHIKTEYHGDTDTILAVYNAVGWAHPYDDAMRQKIQKAFQNATKTYYAMQDDRLVGFLRLLSDDANDTYVTEIVIHPDAQNQGIGRAILAQAQADYAHTAFYVPALKNSVGFFEQCGLQNNGNTEMLFKKSA